MPGFLLSKWVLEITNPITLWHLVSKQANKQTNKDRYVSTYVCNCNFGFNGNGACTNLALLPPPYTNYLGGEEPTQTVH